MQKDKLTHYSTDSILPGKVIIKEKIIVNKNRLYIEDAHYPTDSVCIINTDNMKLINTITYKTQKNDTGIIRELYLHKDELYVVVDENGTNFGKRPKLKIYKLADNKIEKVKFDYLDTLKEYYINCFTFDEEDNLILFLSVFEDQVDNYGHGEIVYFKDGLMKKRIRTPKVRHNNQQLKSYDIAVEMATYNNEIWMASNMYGILRMTNASDVKEDVIVNFGRDIEITSISPNPSSSQVTLNYFCHPAKQQELKVEAVDILGRKISIDDYHILNYDSSTGLGTMTLNISQLNLGVSIITLNLYNSKAGKVFYRN